MIILAVAMTAGLLAVVPVTSYAAVNVFDKACKSNKDVICKSTGTETNASNAIKDIINLLLYILGVIAVIAIIIGGLRYVVSGGDSNAVKGAKDMILFAVIGLIVALLAYSIVNFVVGRF